MNELEWYDKFIGRIKMLSISIYFDKDSMQAIASISDDDGDDLFSSHDWEVTIEDGDGKDISSQLSYSHEVLHISVDEPHIH